MLEAARLVETVDVQELFLFPDKDSEDDEASRVEGDFVDLEPVLRDAVVLDLPFIPLCSADCASSAPGVGPTSTQIPNTVTPVKSTLVGPPHRLGERQRIVIPRPSGRYEERV